MATRVKTVIGLGDSNAAGCGSPNKYGWMQRMRDRFYELNADSIGQYKSWFYDLAVPGETLDTLSLGTAEKEVGRRDRDTQITLSVLSIGGQQLAEDIRSYGKPKPEVFASRIGALMAELFELGDVLYVGIPAPDLGRLKLLSSDLGDFQESDLAQSLREYEEAASEQAMCLKPDDRESMAIALYDYTSSHPDYTNAADGVHPSDEGHAVIFEYVQPLFENMVTR